MGVPRDLGKSRGYRSLYDAIPTIIVAGESTHKRDKIQLKYVACREALHDHNRNIDVNRQGRSIYSVP